MKSFKKEMAVKFKMSDRSMVHYYLRIKVKQGTSGISLVQGAYAMRIMERSGMLGCNPSLVPMEVRLKLTEAHIQPMIDIISY
jgi:hypothetical protein